MLEKWLASLPPWYHKIEKRLEPAQPIVYALGILLIIITAWMLVQPSRSLRTLWVTYMWMP